MDFRKLFGLSAEKIHSTCIILPFLPVGFLEQFVIAEQCKGFPFFTSQDHEHNISLIRTGIGPSFVGDAVLALQETPCRNLIFLGSCGLINLDAGLHVGDVVFPEKVYSLESFSELLRGEKTLENILSLRCDQAKKEVSAVDKSFTLSPVRLISFGSVLLESVWQARLREKLNIDVVDMECAAFFFAAEHIKRSANAFLYVSDVLADENAYEAFQAQNSAIVQNASKVLAEICLKIAD